MRFHTYVAGISLIALLAGCGQSTAGAPGGAGGANREQNATAGQANPGAARNLQLQPVLATSEIVVGPNRLALGLLENNVPIPDAANTRVKVRYYKVNGDQATLMAEEEARYFGEGLGNRGTFVVRPSFDTPGTWGLEIIAERPGKAPSAERIGIDVAAKGSAIAVGDPAPKSRTPSAGQVKDLHTITSSSQPDPRLYQMSIAEAVTSGKPSLILFATPGFCQTQVCGPGVEVLQRLVDTYGDRVNAVHVEVYRYPFEQLQQVGAMKEWGLRTEPWLFLVDREGRVVDRYEGGITVAEVEPAVAKLVR
jgi:hypothetical protein